MVDEARNPYNSSMDEILIEGRVFISSKQAAKITGYAKDYVGQLCREGRVDARLVGRNWYVLQDSIREHRFGKPEEDAHNAPEIETSAAEDRISTWQRPQYQAETPAFVADLAPKTPTTAANPAIQDMQSAWKEWFEERKPTAATFSGEHGADKSEDLLVMSSEDSANETEMIEEVEEVVISHITQEPVYESPEPEEESRVELHRSYGSRMERESVRTDAVPVADISSKASQKRTARFEEEFDDDRSGSGIMRAVIVVVALAAVLVAIVGTGNAERLLAGTSFDFGAQKSVIDFLGGKSTYESSL